MKKFDEHRFPTYAAEDGFANYDPVAFLRARRDVSVLLCSERAIDVRLSNADV